MAVTITALVVMTLLKIAITAQTVIAIICMVQTIAVTTQDMVMAVMNAYTAVAAVTIASHGVIIGLVRVKLGQIAWAATCLITALIQQISSHIVAM